MNLFIDTSALVKLYHKEAGTESLTKLFHHYTNDLVITIADISKIEFHSAFLKRVRTKEIELETVKKVFESFDRDSQLFNVVEVDTVVKNLAIQLLTNIAYQINLRTLDAIQLASAIISNQIVSIDYFVVCDKNLVDVSKKYFHTFNPEIETI